MGFNYLNIRFELHKIGKTMPPLNPVAKKRFRILVQNGVAALPQLPYIHSTDIYSLSDMSDSGQLRPQECPVFTGEYLTYMFYGRPAFRPNSGEDPVSLEHYLPVCLIFKSTANFQIRRMFPFDTGAFKENYYSRYMHKSMKIDDFFLEVDPETPGKIVSIFYNNVENYLKGEAGIGIDNLDPSNFEAKSYQALINAKDSNEVDSRSSGIEIQVSEAVDLDESLLAVIMPSTFAKGDVARYFTDHKIDILSYQIKNRYKPTEYTSSIHDICMSFYAKMGLISEGNDHG